MEKIPVHAKVECADGSGGESVTIIVNPLTQEVTHVVVQNRDLPAPAQRLVPIEYVESTSSDQIRLNCNLDQLAGMEPFTETQYVKAEITVPVTPVYDHYYLPYVTPMGTTEIPMEVERVPLGKLAVRRGTLVEATDGFVGEVGELVLDPESGHVTHLMLKEGHLFGKKETMLPLSAIDFVSADTVYLKLDKKAIEVLPALPVKRNYTKQMELIARVFDNEEQAGKALEFVQDLQKRRLLKILDAAILVKDKEGNVTLKDVRDIDAKKGRLLGAITGGIIGLVGGPVGVVVGALAGAGAGSLAGKWIDFGFSGKFLAQLQEYLQPGSSALILLIEHEWVEEASSALSELGGVVLHQTLTDKMVEDLLQESGAAE